MRKIYEQQSAVAKSSRESSSDEHVVLFRNFSFDDLGVEFDWSTLWYEFSYQSNARFNKSLMKDRRSLFPRVSRPQRMSKAHAILMLVCHQFLENALLSTNFKKEFVLQAHTYQNFYDAFSSHEIL